MSGTGTRPGLTRESEAVWRIERQGSMRVPGVIFASEKLLPQIVADRAIEQVINVASLPGIVDASYAMPDIHWGYGFPIGGVAATDVARNGVISPGGVGFDISCGVRLLTSTLGRPEISPVLPRLLDELEACIPRGLGRGAVWDSLGPDDLNRVLIGGAQYAVECGHGLLEDLARCEDHGTLPGADPAAVSERALLRGRGQLGSLGAGNHFLEIQYVDTIFDETTAAAFGLGRDEVCVLIHSGSRGLGHQICSDHVRTMQSAMARHGIAVPDRQLACVPVESEEGRRYLSAMAAAANYGRANRQLLCDATRRAFQRTTGSGALRLLYDVSHNLAQLEWHEVDGERRLLCVHRKGATRALSPGHPELPTDLREWGQPVLVPGSMGTASYVLAGVAGSRAFHSTCHGAGRTMSRAESKRRTSGRSLVQQLEREGVMIRAGSNAGVAEEAPRSYKDVDEVVLACETAGLARRVARLRPLGVLKG